MIRELALAAMVASGAGAAARAAGPEVLGPELRFVLGPDLEAEAGLATTDSLARLLWLYDAPLADAVRIDERTTLGRGLGVLGRSLKVVFVDWPLASLAVTVAHEAFGHGARAAAQGGDPRFVFRVPSPWDLVLEPGSEAAWDAATDLEATGNLDVDLAVYAAGIDLDNLHAGLITARTVRRGGRMHYAEALRYLEAKSTYVASLADPRRARDGNDVDRYVDLLALRHGRWREADVAALADTLQGVYLATALLDWTFWWSIYQTGRYIAEGETMGTLPLIALGDVHLLPTVRLALSPFGPEPTLEVLAAWDTLLVGARVRHAFGGLASAWGAGLEAFGWRPGAGLELGLTAHVWSQPALVLGARGVVERPQRWGGAAALHLTWTFARGLGLTGKLAYKARGYLAGHPLDAGLYGFVGLSVALDDRPGLVGDDGGGGVPPTGIEPATYKD